MNLTEKLKILPGQPGVYLLKDKYGEIIYVGKAKVLRNRVRSYFQDSRHHTYKTHILKKHIYDFDYIVTDSEVEALILEANLIKKHQPKFNIRLKDDKTYPYIKVTINEDFPGIFKTRLIKKDGARYFGPYADVDAVYKTLRILKKIFPIRMCKKKIKDGKFEDRACLNYYIKKCPGPCIGAISQKDYRQIVNEVILFLEGKADKLIRDLEERMNKAAQELDFEKAAFYRDSIRAIEKVTQNQKVVTEDLMDRDVVAVAVEDDRACLQVMIIRKGRLLGQEHFIMEGTAEEELGEVMSAFIKQYYLNQPILPKEILLEIELSEEQTISEWLKDVAGRKVKLHVPKRGLKKQLVEMAHKNAKENLKKERIKEAYALNKPLKGVKELQDYLGLKRPPIRIEGFDISHIQGTDTVASMVVFENGQPKKEDYRRFKIRSTEGSPDDFASMKEVVSRRYRRVLEEGQKMPDLIIIDGGKGQLNAAVAVLKELGINIKDQSIIGLAKREEEVFLPGQSDPILLPRHSEALYLIQRVRDEAHRFAVNYHRQLRTRRLTHTLLDEIPGIGPKRRQALLQHFGSLEKIRSATIEEFCQVEGISEKTAETIRKFLDSHFLAD
ncbi:excinuclease ABC subunit C [Anoxybacter fermentans]|uniref:UvrABC system protein C n=1 Tax=Anoxybacter fermentans TaxID=1323375 RepID=A0A3Q9HNQ7_9FIRM|nr:excinuclease ABC subunit UvrC [Anoxybacter fermentans]AZR72219.1 excinuclease ABC subunit C [Anoxybacter fermentans]